MRIRAAILLVAILVGAMPPAFAQSIVDSDSAFRVDSHRPVRPDYSKRIGALLGQMTVEEKVGQMTQLTIDMVTSGSEQAIEIDSEKLETAVVRYGVGSILNVNNQALSLDHWHRIIGPIQQAARRTRLKIPVIYGIDSIHGANYVLGSTLFPQQLGMASTWDPVLMKKAAEITAKETRAAGIAWSFSPVLDVGRNQAWPRLWETFGEDPYLATVMGMAFVRGLEGWNTAGGDHVASSLKHYVGYSMSATGRDRTPAVIPEHYLREYLLPPFAAAIKGGARTVMINSAEINGVPGHINKRLITQVLKDELGFDGFVVTDWDDIRKLVTQWRVAVNEKEATRLAVLAGIDMSMVPLSYSFSDYLVELVKEGSVPMSRIDDAVRRILRVKFELGLFENAMPDPSLRSNHGRSQYAEIALDAARQSIILLKNQDNILPLSKSAKVLVTGPTADSMISLNNGWTYVWQGSEPSLYPKDKPTIQKAIEAKIGPAKFKYIPGTRLVRRPDSPSNSTPTDIDEEVDINAAVEAAKASDIVVLCLGEGSYTEHAGSLADLTLPELQLQFAERIIGTGKPVVLLLSQGRPRVISRIADKVAGILLAFNPGNEGGRAFADVLFGDYNPSGKLPITYPRSPGYLTTYDANVFERVMEARKVPGFQPQYPFGHGLSYTSFAYSDIRLSSDRMTRNSSLDLSVSVTNTGKQSGMETAIVYVRDEVASLTPAAKRVRRFAKVNLAPGETKTLNFTIRPEDLGFFGLDNKLHIEPGEFTIFVGDRSAKFTLE
ncbi:MAG TPA: glycoside hydrolase family 3 N-terminal domain-containing protein [Pyrinomonadaceae bacterium]